MHATAGNFDESSAEKRRLEEKQRAARKAREETGVSLTTNLPSFSLPQPSLLPPEQIEFLPRWFEAKQDEQLGRVLWCYKGMSMASVLS